MKTSRSGFSSWSLAISSITCDRVMSQVRMSMKTRSGSIGEISDVGMEESHGAVSRARTSDFKIFSLALSQLSYHGVNRPYRDAVYKVL